MVWNRPSWLAGHPAQAALVDIHGGRECLVQPYLHRDPGLFPGSHAARGDAQMETVPAQGFAVVRNIEQGGPYPVLGCKPVRCAIRGSLVSLSSQSTLKPARIRTSGSVFCDRKPWWDQSACVRAATMQGSEAAVAMPQDETPGKQTTSHAPSPGVVSRLQPSRPKFRARAVLSPQTTRSTGFAACARCGPLAAAVAMARAMGSADCHSSRTIWQTAATVAPG